MRARNIVTIIAEHRRTTYAQYRLRIIKELELKSTGDKYSRTGLEKNTKIH